MRQEYRLRKTERGYESAVSVIGTTYARVTNSLRAAGFEQVPVSQIPPADMDVAESAARGPVEPRAFAQFHRGNDTVGVMDWTPAASRQTDPTILVVEERPNTTSLVVREVLSEELETEAILCFAEKGERSQAFRQCVVEIAVLRDQSLFEAQEDVIAKAAIVLQTTAPKMPMEREIRR